MRIYYLAGINAIPTEIVDTSGGDGLNGALDSSLTSYVIKPAMKCIKISGSNPNCGPKMMAAELPLIPRLQNV
jgi:hypothetical protein